MYSGILLLSVSCTLPCNQHIPPPSSYSLLNVFFSAYNPPPPPPGTIRSLDPAIPSQTQDGAMVSFDNMADYLRVLTIFGRAQVSTQSIFTHKENGAFTYYPNGASSPVMPPARLLLSSLCTAAGATTHGPQLDELLPVLRVDYIENDVHHPLHRRCETKYILYNRQKSAGGYHAHALQYRGFVGSFWRVFFCRLVSNCSCLRARSTTTYNIFWRKVFSFFSHVLSACSFF